MRSVEGQVSRSGERYNQQCLIIALVLFCFIYSR
jgi:hypothetical protein